MQSRQARSNSLSCVVRPNSSSVLILLWLLYHLHLFAFHHFRTITHLSIYLRDDYWSQRIWLGSWDSVGSGNMSHCRTSLSFNTQVKDSSLEELPCERKINVVWIFDPWECFPFWIVCEMLNELHICSKMGHPVLYDSDSYFQEMRQSDPINQALSFRPVSMLHPTKWFGILLNCAELKFGPYTSNLWEQVKSESWNSPTLHCLTAFAKWKYCLYSHVCWM